MTADMKSDDCFLARKVMTNLDSVLKSRDITLLTSPCQGAGSPPVETII